jgi:hypothetical protein
VKGVAMMVKDDYQVLVVYMLAYLYDCLKTGKQPKEEELNEQFFQINQKYYQYIVTNMVNDELIRGVRIINVLGGVSIDGIEKAEITPKGIDMLFDNTTYQKAKRVVKDISDFTSILSMFK